MLIFQFLVHAIYLSTCQLDKLCEGVNSSCHSLSLIWLLEACMSSPKTRITVVRTALNCGHLEYCTTLSFIMVKAVAIKSSHVFKVVKPSRSASNGSAVGSAGSLIDGVNVHGDGA